MKRKLNIFIVYFILLIYFSNISSYFILSSLHYIDHYIDHYVEHIHEHGHSHEFDSVGSIHHEHGEENHEHSHGYLIDKALRVVENDSEESANQEYLISFYKFGDHFKLNIYDTVIFNNPFAGIITIDNSLFIPDYFNKPPTPPPQLSLLFNNRLVKISLVSIH